MKASAPLCRSAAGATDALRSARDAAARLERLLTRLTARVLPGRGHVLANQAGNILPFLEGEAAATRSRSDLGVGRQPLQCPASGRRGLRPV